MTAVFDERKHPRHPKGTPEGGEFAPLEIATTAREAVTPGGQAFLASEGPFETGMSINAFWDPKGGFQGNGDWEMKQKGQWRRIDPSEPHMYADLWPDAYVSWGERFGRDPVLLDTSPPNPRGSADFVKKWVVGRGGQNSFPWFTELRSEYAAQMGLPDPGITRTWAPHEGRPPTGPELRKATEQFIETLPKAPPEQPALWRGLGDVSDPWAKVVAAAKPGDTLEMLPASYSRSAVKAGQYAYDGRNEAVMLYVLPGSRGLADKRPWLRDEEVISAGSYEVVASERVRPGGDYRRHYAAEEPGKGTRVVTVRQVDTRPGVQASAWVESAHPRHPAGDPRGGEFSPSGDREFQNRIREALHVMMPPGEFTPDESVKFWPKEIGAYSGYNPQLEGPFWKGLADMATGEEKAFWFVNRDGFPHHAQMRAALNLPTDRIYNQVSGYGDTLMGASKGIFTPEAEAKAEDAGWAMARRHRRDIRDAEAMVEGAKEMALAASALNFESEALVKAVARLQRQYEKVYRRAAKRAKADYLAAMKVVHADATPDEIVKALALVESFHKLTGAARRAMLGEVLDAFKLIQEATAKGEDDSNAHALELYLDLLQSQAGVQAERLVAGAQDAAANVMLDSVAQGWSVPQTATALKLKLESIAPWQATMLARTDLVALANGASLRRAVTLSDPQSAYKTWLATPDERTRIDHRHAHGQTVPVQQPFTVGGEQLLYPGDPSASDGNVINCRCTVIYGPTPFGPEGVRQIAMLPDLAVSAAGWDESEHPRDPGLRAASPEAALELHRTRARDRASGRAFVEAEHPRHPAGTPEGGEFAPKGAAVDWSPARAEFEKWAADLAPYYTEDQGYPPGYWGRERLKAWEQYQAAVNTTLPALQARLNGAQVPGLRIIPELNPAPGGDMDAVLDPERGYGPDFQVELPAAEDGLTPGFTVWTYPDQATEVEDVLDITDTDFFPDGPDSDLAGDYARAVDAARGVPDEPGYVTIYRGMSDAEYDAWLRGDEIPMGKFFAGIPTTQYAQDVSGQPPQLYTFRAPRSMLMQTGPNEYQLKKRGRLGKPGELEPSQPVQAAGLLPSHWQAVVDAISAAAFEEAEHPRHPAGTPEGGQFSEATDVFARVDRERAEAQAWREAGEPEYDKGAKGVWYPDREMVFESDKPGIIETPPRRRPGVMWKAMKQDGRWLFWTTDTWGAPHHDQVARKLGIRFLDTGQRFSGAGLMSARDERNEPLNPELQAVINRHSRELRDAEELALAAAAVNYEGSGGMVALYPEPEEAEAIARVNGQPPGDLHVTLLYFENGVPENAADALGDLSFDGLEGQISGIARFQEGEDGVPVVGLVSAVGLNELRAELADRLPGYSERHGFVPHLTLGYDQGEDPLVEDPEGAVGLPVTFSAVKVKNKDGEPQDVLTAAGWNEAEHPREPAGTEKGGQFTSYHISPSRNRGSIAREGLRPGSVFTDSEKEAEAFAEFYRSVEPEPYDVWQLDREGVRVEPDPDYTRGGIPGTWVAPSGVGPERMKLLRQGTPPAWWNEPTTNRFLQDKGWTKGQEIMDWLARNEVKQDGDGRFILYHATPKGAKFDRLRAGSLLEYDPEKAAFFAMRDRGLRRDQVEVIEIHAYPWELVNGVFGAVREDFPVGHAVRAAGWDESAHPRWPAGDERGGEFAPKDAMTVSEARVGLQKDGTYRISKAPNLREWLEVAMPFRPDILDDWPNLGEEQAQQLRRELQHPALARALAGRGLGKERQELKWVLRDLGEDVPIETIVSDPPGPKVAGKTTSLFDKLEIGGGRHGSNMLEGARTVDRTISYPVVPGEPKRIQLKGAGSAQRNASFWRTRPELKPSHITVNANAIDPVSSTVHELGHYLDSLLGQDRWASDPAFAKGRGYWQPYSSEQRPVGTLQPVLEAVKGTEMYQKLEAASGARWDANSFTYGGRRFAPGAAHIRYLLKPPEVVARSFEQYIASKNPGSKLSSTVRHAFSDSEELGTPDFPGYMKGQDLENVNRVWDQVLDQRGLLKKRDEGRMAASAT